MLNNTPFHSPLWPIQTAHQIFWERNNCPFVYEYDPTDDGPEVEIATRIRAAYFDYADVQLAWERGVAAWQRAVNEIVEQSAKELAWSHPEAAL